MTTYVDVAVSRIQGYLAITRSLSGRRGASAMIRANTSRWAGEGLTREGPSVDPVERLCEKLAELDPACDGWKRADDAGDIDGVISLRHDGYCEDDFIRAKIIEPIITWLRSGFLTENRTGDASPLPGIPGAEIHCYWFSCRTALNYVEAHQLMREEPPKVVALPAVSDFPGWEPCSECNRTPIVHVSYLRDPKTGDETSQRLCADCVSREAHRGRQAENSCRDPNLIAPSFTAEHELRRRVEKDSKQIGDQHYGAVDDFPHLARLGRSNHLATIAIDGNRIGQLFQDLPKESKKKAVHCLTEATWSALTTATKAVISPSAQRDSVSNSAHIPVVPHVVGGDDVLVSVPAKWAWPFVLAFLNGFEVKAGEVFGPDRCPSAGVGMVFARHNVPFIDVMENAEELLAEAKRHTQGKTSAVAWSDMTVDGPFIQKRSPRSLEYLKTMLELQAEIPSPIMCVESITETGKASLVEVANRGLRDAPADAAKRARLSIVDMCRRNEWNIDAFKTGPDDELDLELLRDVIDISRRWKRP